MKAIRKIALMAIMLTTMTTAASAQAYVQSQYYNPQSGSLDYSKQHHKNKWWSGMIYTDQYYGLRLGPAFTTVNSDNPELNGDNMKTGLNIGFVYGHELTSDAPLYLETGLYYTEKGGKGEVSRPSANGQYSVSSNMKYNLNYLKVPALVKYVYEIDDNMSIQPFGGAYVALGVGGKIKDYGERIAYSSFGSHDDQFQMFDGGLQLGCGFGFDFFYAEVAYEFGLANVCHDDFDASHNSSLSVTIGVNF